VSKKTGVITGGRKCDEREHLFATLDRLHAEHDFTLLSHGDARGVDRLGCEWGNERGVEVILVKGIEQFTMVSSC
jgi:hypothetical protein